jgi:quercetin dioxygenase-like cupin family protein
MEATDFYAILRAEGFPEAARRSLPAGQAAPDHTHDFDAKVLILAGAFTVTKDGIATTHRPGDVFAMPAGHRHAEQAGPDGVEYLSARRQPAG